MPTSRVYAYKVKGGKIVPAGDQVSAERARTRCNTSRGRDRGSRSAPRTCRRGGRAAPIYRRSDGSPDRPFLGADRHGLTLGSDLRARRARVHPGVRRAAADQLRPLRGLHARHLRRAVRDRVAWASSRRPPGSAGAHCSSASCCVSVSALVALLLGASPTVPARAHCAPLIDRSRATAPRFALAALISAIAQPSRGPSPGALAP